MESGGAAATLILNPNQARDQAAGLACKNGSLILNQFGVPGVWPQARGLNLKKTEARDKTGGPILNQHLVPGAWSQVRDLNLEKMEMGTRTGYIKLALHPILCLSQLHSCTDDSKARPSLIICRVAGVRSLPYAALTGLRTQSPPPPASFSLPFQQWSPSSS